MCNFHIWPNREAGLAEIRRVLKPGGTLLLAVRTAPRRPGKYPPGLDEDAIRRAVAEVEAARFDDLRLERRDTGRQVVCTIGRKTGGEVDTDRLPRTVNA